MLSRACLLLARSEDNKTVRVVFPELGDAPVDMTLDKLDALYTGRAIYARPKLQFDARSPAFFWLAAQGGYGIQSAAGASRLAADLLLGQPLCPSLVRQGVAPERLSPARFQQP